MVYLVRQGQTDWNLLKKFNGCTDIELNRTGIKQAKAQAERIKEVSLDACFCSPQKGLGKPAKSFSREQLYLMKGSLKLIMENSKVRKKILKRLNYFGKRLWAVIRVQKVSKTFLNGIVIFVI